MDHITRAFTHRSQSLFQPDLAALAPGLGEALAGRRVIVFGGAGTIGSSTVRQLLAFPLARLDIVDIAENNLAETLRDIRSGPLSSFKGELRTFCVDAGAEAGVRLIEREGPFDLALNFAAIKHVRGERDLYSLLHMIDVNVRKLQTMLEALARVGCARVFSVSSDKAANPASLMGATKRLMERLLCEGTWPASTCTSRFANVAFSDGSLLHSWRVRFEKRQPLAGPSDVRRYFYSGEEAGQVCLLASTLAPPGHVVVPALERATDTHTFTEIVTVFLQHLELEPRWYQDAAEARGAVERDLAQKRYPCVFLPSDTAGEKEEEEFVMDFEEPRDFGPAFLRSFPCRPAPKAGSVHEFLTEVQRVAKSCDRQALVEAFKRALPELRHVERPGNLDQKM